MQSNVIPKTKTLMTFEIMAVLTILASIGLSIRLFWEDALFTNTLSSIGERYRSWFLAFSLSLSFAFMINLSLILYRFNMWITHLKDKTRQEKKKIIIFMVAIAANLPLAILQALIIDLSVQVEHIILAGLWVAQGGICIMICMGIAVKVNGRDRAKYILPILAVWLVLGVISLYFLLAHWTLLAFIQILIAYSLIAAVVCIRYFERPLKENLEMNKAQDIQQ